jgi:hypothetical protein
MPFTAVSFHEIIPVAIEAMKAYGYDPKDNWKKVCESFRRVASNICVGRQYVVPDTSNDMTPGAYQFDKMRFLYEVCRSPTMLKPYNKFCVSTNTSACNADDFAPQNQDPTYDRYEFAFYAPYGGKHHGICDGGIADGIVQTIDTVDKFWMRINVKGSYKRKPKTSETPAPPPKRQRTPPPPAPAPEPVPPPPSPEPEEEFHECEEIPVPPVVPKAPWPKDVMPWVVLGLEGPRPIPYTSGTGYSDHFQYDHLSDRDVAKAYRKTSLKHHPDRGGCAEAFKIVGQAKHAMRSDRCRRAWAYRINQPMGHAQWDWPIYDPV